MYKKNRIINIYNQISDEKIDYNKLSTILPKLYLILNKVELDEIEVVIIIDVLKEFEKYNLLDKINVESIDLINKIVKKNNINLEGNVYFSETIKHILIPYDKNVCDRDYNIVLFLSEFEILLELIYQNLNKKDLVILDKYNHELYEIVLKYKEIQNIYKQVVYGDVILSSYMSHLSSILYFRLDLYEYDYDLMKEVFVRLLNNYQSFIDYCCKLGIQKNYTRIYNDMFYIELEYITSNNMLKYVYDEKKNEKIKRK